MLYPARSSMLEAHITRCDNRPLGISLPAGPRTPMVAQPSPPMLESRLSSLKRIHQGKVRDIYAIDEQRMLIVTTDRLSAFDVVLPDPIPGKGRVLTQISNF